MVRVVSAEPVTAHVPSGEKATARTPRELVEWATACPMTSSRTSQILSVLSPEAETTVRLSSLTAMFQMRPPCPVKTALVSPVATSQTRTVLSEPHETSSAPFFQKTQLRATAPCPINVWTISPVLMSQSLMVSLPDGAAIYLLS